MFETYMTIVDLNPSLWPYHCIDMVDNLTWLPKNETLKNNKNEYVHKLNQDKPIAKLLKIFNIYIFGFCHAST
jgi:hypothetical protein